MGCRCAECDEIQTKFSGKAWQSLRPSLLEYWYDALPLFTPDALHYYLPAYLVLALKNPIKYCNIWERTISNLCPPKQIPPDEDNWLNDFGETQYEYFIHRMQGYTSEQKAAIANYLRYQQRDEPNQDFSSAIHWWETSES
jgi:hypothetical protein